MSFFCLIHIFFLILRKRQGLSRDSIRIVMFPSLSNTVKITDVIPSIPERFVIMIKFHLFSGFVYVIVGILICSSAWAEESKGKHVFRAGAATANITPPLGISMVGHMRDRAAQNVHDELHVRSLALDDGDTTILLIVCDLLALGRETIDKAKYLISENTGIPEDRLLIACTHTHTGPTTVGVFQSEPDIEYLDWLITRIADSARMAVHNLRPARIGWGVGKEEKEVFNRRFLMKPGTMPENPWGKTDDQVKMNPGYENPNVVKPAGPIDPDVWMLSVQDLDGKPIAVLGNYTLHYVGGVASDDLSADYFGVWANIIEREYAKQSNSNSRSIHGHADERMLGRYQ